MRRRVSGGLQVHGGSERGVRRVPRLVANRDVVMILQVERGGGRDTDMKSCHSHHTGATLTAAAAAALCACV